MTMVSLPELTGDFKLYPHDIPVGLTWGLLLPADPTRFAILFCNGASSPYMVRNTIPAGTPAGITVTSSQPPVFLNFRDHPTAPGLAWYAQSTGAATIAYVIEILYQPPGE